MENGVQELLVKANIVLIAHLEEIHTLEDWANCLNYGTSAQWFARHYFKCYHERPKKVIIKTRLLRIYELLIKDHHLSGFELAWQVGLDDEKALYEFLTYHTGMNLTELKTLIKML
ncbi:MAG TPA: hypothetical protein VKA34_11960 [Balneolales bacterium]|nr:hypothetical protein [Balneolales bacterium]